MYTGQTEQPCCLCNHHETVSRLDLPPRAIKLMKNSGSIAWRDVVGTVSIHFCADDWNLIRDLITEMQLNPLGRCNVAQASFSIREDFEAVLSDTKPEPDQTAVEERLISTAQKTLAEIDSDPLIEERDHVEALLTLQTLMKLDVISSTKAFDSSPDPES